MGNYTVWDMYGMLVSICAEFRCRRLGIRMSSDLSVIQIEVGESPEVTLVFNEIDRLCCEYRRRVLWTYL